ncbi:MAG TPA: hypothetical protein PLX89_10280 [Verrucomicrobiota bacterium]|nr:hypothetical protein [Verrucomicrobiales bacterium]HRI13383.1 hypothetical protein [Verrucomicrobiota bacterium]
MKMHHTSLTVIISLVFGARCVSGEFKNLSFDTPEFPSWFPNPIPDGPFEGTFGEWIRPGWSSTPQSAVGYNYTQRFAGQASILDRDFRDTHFGANSPVPVVGSFALGIWPASGRGFQGMLQPYVLTQTGDLPSDALSLRFLYHGDDLRVYVAGEQLPLFAQPDVPSGNPDIPFYHYFAVDVSPYAGTTSELKFEFRSFGYDDFSMEPRPIGYPDAKSHVLDDLSFSTSPVPEPLTWTLAGLGGVFLAWMLRGRHR